MDATVEKQVLEWRFNPWASQSGPPWRRPAVALIVSLLVCVLFGYAVSYPNMPENYGEQLAAAAADTSLDPELRERAETRLAEHLHQQDNWQWQMLGWAGIALVLLFGMTAMLYLPVRYQLDNNGVTVFFLGVPNVRKWSYYRNFYAHDTGIHLTTMPTPSAFDPFRGHFMQFSGNREEVVAFVRTRLVLRGVADLPKN